MEGRTEVEKEITAMGPDWRNFQSPLSKLGTGWMETQYFPFVLPSVI